MSTLDDEERAFMGGTAGSPSAPKAGDTQPLEVSPGASGILPVTGDGPPPQPEPTDPPDDQKKPRGKASKFITSQEERVKAVGTKRPWLLKLIFGILALIAGAMLLPFISLATMKVGLTPLLSEFFKLPARATPPRLPWFVPGGFIEGLVRFVFALLTAYLLFLVVRAILKYRKAPKTFSGSAKLIFSGISVLVLVSMFLWPYTLGLLFSSWPYNAVMLSFVKLAFAAAVVWFLAKSVWNFVQTKVLKRPAPVGEPSQVNPPGKPHLFGAALACLLAAGLFTLMTTADKGDFSMGGSLPSAGAVLPVADPAFCEGGNDEACGQYFLGMVADRQGYAQHFTDVCAIGIQEGIVKIAEYCLPFIDEDPNGPYAATSIPVREAKRAAEDPPLIEYVVGELKKS